MTEGASELPVKPAAAPCARWPRRRRIQLALTAALLAAAGLAVYRWHRGTVVEPPAIALDAMDPAVASAIEQATKAVVASPRSGPAWGKLGMVLLAHRFLDEARACFVQAERFDARDLRWPYFHACSMCLTDPAASIAHLQRAVELCGDGPSAPRLRLAELLLRQGRRDEAVDQFQIILGRSGEPGGSQPGLTRPAYERAQALAQLHDHVRARAHLGLARAAYEQGRLQDSIAYLRGATDNPSTATSAHILLAEIHQRLGDSAAAATERRLVGVDLPKLSPQMDPIYQEVEDLIVGEKVFLTNATNLLKGGRIAEAVNLLRKMLDSYPASDDGWQKLGLALYVQRDLGGAKQALRRALEITPTLVDGHFSLGLVFREEGDLGAAAQSFRRAIELKPADASAHFYLGDCLTRLGDRVGAIEAFNNARRLQPNFAAVPLNLSEQARKLLQELENKDAGTGK